MVTSLVCLSLFVRNDGWIGFSGAPKIEGKHPSVRMVNEQIHLKVGQDTLYGDCVFTFKNEGPACNVRIGFPDFNSNDEVEEPPQSTYKSFRSVVDDVLVPTKLVRGNQGTAWQIKSVAFGRGQTRKIRNIYHLKLGKITLNGSPVKGRESMCWQGEYILGTGRSWKGKIGKTTVTVDFGSSALIQSPIVPMEWPDAAKSDSSNFWVKNKNAVIWSGPTPPRIAGKRRLVFEIKNWEPEDLEESVKFRFGVYPKPYF